MTDKSSIAVLSAAVELYNVGRFAEALERLRTLGERRDARLLAAHCLDSLGQVDKAVAELRALERLGKDKGAASLALAAILRREGRPGAETCLRRALRADPGNARAREELSSLEAERRRNPAIEARRRALRLRDAGRLDEARKALMKLPPSDERSYDLAEVDRLAALRSERDGHWAAAEKAWRRLSLDPGRAEEARTRLMALALFLIDDDLSDGVDVRRRLWSLLRRCKTDTERTPVLSLLRDAAARLERSSRAGAAASLLESLERIGSQADRKQARIQRLDLLGRRVGVLRRSKRTKAADRLARGLVSLSGGQDRFRRLASGAVPRKATRFDALQLLMRGAEVELQRGELEAARGLWRTAVERLIEPLDANERAMRFRLLVALGDYREAFSEAERALERGALSDGTTLACFLNPWAVTAPYMRDGRIFAADCRVLDDMAVDGGWGPWPAFFLGLIGHRAGRDDWRVQLERAAVLAAPRHAFMSLEICRMRLNSLEVEKALESARGAAALLPPSVGWHAACYAAEAALALGRSDEGLGLFENAVKWSGRFRGDALAWKGEGLLWLGRYDEADRVLSEAIDAGGAPYAYCWRGAARFKLKRLEPALADFDFGLRVYDRDLESYAWRAEVLSALGRHEEAAACAQVEPLRAGFDGALCLPERAMPGVDDSWRWHLIARARARHALGDEAGMRADYARVPRWARVLAEGPWPDAPAGEIAAALERLQARAGGCRRPELYPDAVWAGLAAVRPAH